MLKRHEIEILLKAGHPMTGKRVDLRLSKGTGEKPATQSADIHRKNSQRNHH
jgi:hypothetical protein